MPIKVRTLCGERLARGVESVMFLSFRIAKFGYQNLTTKKEIRKAQLIYEFLQETTMYLIPGSELYLDLSEIIL